MNLNIQMKINSDPNQLKYLREYSYWYKYLNRSEAYYKDFLKAMKETYKLKPSDKLNQIVDNINMFKAFLEVLK